MNEKLLDILACPICQGRLKYDKENEQLICTFEQLAYPIEQGIPVLLAERAIALQPENEKQEKAQKAQQEGEK
ncbi:Trm112 family protein [Avibacterium avium]|uniref:Trm112 family protein n=1 Tax=Avibacterium avium TaxID=751 RepID=UPI003BF893B9